MLDAVEWKKFKWFLFKGNQATALLFAVVVNVVDCLVAAKKSLEVVVKKARMLAF